MNALRTHRSGLAIARLLMGGGACAAGFHLLQRNAASCEPEQRASGVDDGFRPLPGMGGNTRSQGRSQLKEAIDSGYLAGILVSSLFIVAIDRCDASNAHRYKRTSI